MLAFTEAGTKRRAALHFVHGEKALSTFDAGGLEVLDTDLATFAGRLASENHTLKRALTDPRLFAGIGNAYSDEILTAPGCRRSRSPVNSAMRRSRDSSPRLAPFSVNGSSVCARRQAAHFRSESRRFDRRWRSTAASASHVRSAAGRCSASSTPRTNAITVRAARPAASSSPIARCRGSCTRAGRGRSTS